MDRPQDRGPPQDKTHALIRCVPRLLLCFWFLFTLGQTSPHLPKRLTWQVVSQTGKVAWSISGSHAPNTWWPNLSPDFCQLAAGLDTWDIPHLLPHEVNTSSVVTGGETTRGVGSIGCGSRPRRCWLAGQDFYVCPQDGRSPSLARKCGGAGDFFCAAWSCETTGDAYWKPTSSWDKIIVQRGWIKPPSTFSGRGHGNPCSTASSSSSPWRCPEGQGLCLPLNISFTANGKKATRWQQGYTWGLRWYLSGKDEGVTFKIKLKTESTTLPVGPNPEL